VACAQAGIEPLIAMGRDAHHLHGSERFSEPAAVPADATPIQRMQHRLKTRQGRAAYALRKQTVEPVVGLRPRVGRSVGRDCADAVGAPAATIV
jgi:hypothetical protein